MERNRRTRTGDDPTNTVFEVEQTLSNEEVVVERTEVTEQFELNQECTFECCKNDLVNPYHPNIAFLSTVKKQGQQHRSFCSNWFKEYNWISFCTTRYKVFSYYCRKSTKTIASSVLNKRTEAVSFLTRQRSDAAFSGFLPNNSKQIEEPN